MDAITAAYVLEAWKDTILPSMADLAEANQTLEANRQAVSAEIAKLQYAEGRGQLYEDTLTYRTFIKRETA